MLTGFDHVNLRTGDVEAMVDWYEGVLGLRSGWRPDFPFPGAWLYLNDQALVHLVGEDKAPATEDPRIEHFAFRAEDRDGFEARCAAMGVAIRWAEVPGAGVVQANVFDPDGNHIHVDFRVG